MKTILQATLRATTAVSEQISGSLDVNPSTLSGAIDVVVVRQPDGSLRSTPFHVRFGKLSVLRPREKVVRIKVNSAPVELCMKLGYSGEAFFVEEAPAVPLTLSELTSPPPGNDSQKKDGWDTRRSDERPSSSCDVDANSRRSASRPSSRGAVEAGSVMAGSSAGSQVGPRPSPNFSRASPHLSPQGSPSAAPPAPPAWWPTWG